MSIDFNEAPEQRSFDLIPDGTLCNVHMTIRPGNAGDGGWLKRSKNGESEGLDCEFVVVDGKYAKRKFWTLFTLGGVTPGQQEAGGYSLGKLRAMIESVRGIRPDDDSQEAREKRKISSFGELDGLRFPVIVGIEKGKDGYKDKNTLVEVITPDKKSWVKVEQIKQTTAPTAAIASQAVPASTGGRPVWAS
jgi:hypothetical protein